MIPFLYLSASFICRSSLSVCSLAAAPAQNSPHGLPSPTVEITYPGQAPIFKHQALPSRNVKSLQSLSHFSFCLFLWTSHSHCFSLSLAISLYISFSCTCAHCIFPVSFSSLWLSSYVALVHRCVQKCSFCEAKANLFLPD